MLLDPFRSNLNILIFEINHYIKCDNSKFKKFLIHIKQNYQFNECNFYNISLGVIF